MSTTHTASLVLSDGTEVDTWDAYTITLDMLQPGSPWTASMWRSSVRQTTWAVLRAKIKLFDKVTFVIDGAPQITGRIETFDTQADREGGARITISGRDMAGPALSWDADPTVRLKGLQLSAALEALFAPLGIPVVIGADADAARTVQIGTTRGSRGVSSGRRTRRTQVCDRAQPQPGEKVWQLADEIARRLGYLIWTAPAQDGGLAVVIDRPAYSSAEVFTFARRITETAAGATAAGNILSGGETFSVRDVPSEVNVYSGTARGASLSARQRYQAVNLAIADVEVTRGFALDPAPAQPRHVRAQRARTVAETAREATRIVSEAMYGFRRYACTVQGHGQTIDGRALLYTVNTMCRVRDDVCTSAAGDPLDESMLATRVEFKRSRKAGTTTEVTLSPRDAISLVPQDM